MDALVQVQLLVELLNLYLYFLEKGNKEIGGSLLNQLISKIKEELPNLEMNEDRDQISSHFENTKIHIRAVQETGGRGGGGEDKSELLTAFKELQLEEGGGGE